tara:strand:+ start:16395 stop:17555 length:1161 start_codon:yes stop_codon:yes gene_type:complete
MVFKTDLLYTALGKPIKNGMIRTDQEGKILEVGANLSVENSEVNYLEGALCPGFINTHCHLELSHLKNKIESGKGLISFIKGVQSQRKAEEEEIQEAILKADEEMWKAGIVAVGDISNGTTSFLQKQKSNIEYHTFVELFGFDPAKATEVWTRGQKVQATAIAMGLSASLVPHSPYSVSKPLFQLLKAEKDNAPICIHNQENEAENELYQNGTGAFRKMLESFGLPLEHIKGMQQNSLPAYLPLLPDSKPLLLVHNTFSNQADITSAKNLHKQLYWCLCPRANQYIENRLANVPLFMQENLKCTLGTDSLASNYGLSILEEMKCIQAHFPEIELEQLIEWGCKNGADFLGKNQLGSFEAGKKPGINWLKNIQADRRIGDVEVEKVL